MLFVFLSLAYLTEHNNLQFCPFCCKCQDFIHFHGWVIFHRVHIPRFLYPVFDTRICWLALYLYFTSLLLWVELYKHVGAGTSYADFIPFGNTPRSGLASSYDRFIFNFLRNVHSIFCNFCDNFYPQQQCIRVKFLDMILKAQVRVFFFLRLVGLHQNHKVMNYIWSHPRTAKTTCRMRK